MYANSEVSKKFISGEFPSCYQELLPGFTPVPPFLIGDPAYPLLPNVMKEYANCFESKQIHFNNSLRTVRNTVERAFGRLKARWRILNRAVDVDLDFAIEMIYACFVLHNFCDKHNVEVNEEQVKAQIAIDRRRQVCEHHNKLDKLYSYNSQRGKNIRDSICDYLWDKLDK